MNRQATGKAAKLYFVTPRASLKGATKILALSKIGFMSIEQSSNFLPLDSSLRLLILSTEIHYRNTEGRLRPCFCYNTWPNLVINHHSQHQYWERNPSPHCKYNLEIFNSLGKQWGEKDSVSKPFSIASIVKLAPWNIMEIGLFPLG